MMVQPCFKSFNTQSKDELEKTHLHHMTHAHTHLLRAVSNLDLHSIHEVADGEVSYTAGHHVAD